MLVVGVIRTVLGDAPSETLGRVNYHEHVFQVSPLLPGDELDEFEPSLKEVVRLRESGFQAMIDATPIGLGRQPDALKKISATTGVSIVATTGLHREAHYVPDFFAFKLSENELGDLFVKEIREGMGESSVKAGILKCGVDYWSISTHQKKVLGALAKAHHETNSPIMIHTEHGSAAFEVVDFLSRLGVSHEAIVLAHMDRNPDPFLHRDLAELGVYVGYDGFGRPKIFPDSVLIAGLSKVVNLGGGSRILIGGDVARRSRYVEYGGMPGLEYLGKRVVPRLEEELGSEAVAMVLEGNAARFLSRF
jgi:phosphotriesterase-related protein